MYLWKGKLDPQEVVNFLAWRNSSENCIDLLQKNSAILPIALSEDN